jgi:hypothetical protein
MIILADKHVIVESGLPNVNSCATPVVPEQAKAGGKNPLPRSSKAPTLSRRGTYIMLMSVFRANVVSFMYGYS